MFSKNKPIHRLQLQLKPNMNTQDSWGISKPTLAAVNTAKKRLWQRKLIISAIFIDSKATIRQ